MLPVRTFTSLGITFVAFATSARSQNFVGRVLLFSQPDFHGQCLIEPIGSSVRDLADSRAPDGRRWDDRIASVRIEGNVGVVLFADPRFRGEQIEFRTSVADLGDMPLGERSTWLRQASSLRVVPIRQPSASIAPLTPAQANQAIINVYADLLGRKPDFASLQFYRVRLVDEGWTIDRLCAALRASPEFPSRNVDALVNHAYLTELGTPPDPNALLSCRQLMAEHGWSETELRNRLRQSDEARRFQASEEVRRAYLTVLHREPDAQGLSAYSTLLLNGWTPRQLEEHLRKSREYKQRQNMP